MLLKLEDNVPEVYVEKSRDFQLLCRVINIYLNYVVQRSAALVSTSNISTMQDDLLPLFARRLGFTSDHYFPPEVLRNICKNYPEMIKYKGTERAIELAVRSTLTASKEVETIEVTSNILADDRITVNILSDASGKNLQYLEELLKFILPAGVLVKYTLNLTQQQDIKTVLKTSNTLKIIKGNGYPISGTLAEPSTSIPFLNLEDLKPAEWIGGEKYYYNRISNARIIKSTPAANYVYATKVEEN